MEKEKEGNRLVTIGSISQELAIFLRNMDCADWAFPDYTVINIKLANLVNTLVKELAGYFHRN